jgi:hypothetical protein
VPPGPGVTWDLGARLPNVRWGAGPFGLRSSLCVVTIPTLRLAVVSLTT